MTFDLSAVNSTLLYVTIAKVLFKQTACFKKFIWKHWQFMEQHWRIVNHCLQLTFAYKAK